MSQETKAVVIEKNVPIPPLVRRQWGVYAEALQELEVGDSFVAEGANMATLNSSIRQSAKRLGIKITARAESKTKLRIWRIEGDSV